MGYGEKIWDEIGDELVELNTEGFNILTDNVTQFWIVDYIRVCKWISCEIDKKITHACPVRFVPSWMPGAKFKYVIKKCRKRSLA
jgi:hypothetical protein